MLFISYHAVFVNVRFFIFGYALCVIKSYNCALLVWML